LVIYLCSTTMKRYISFYLTFICFVSIQAMSVKGLCVDGSKMYYVVEKTLYCQDVRSNAVLKTYEPNKDTALTGSLSRRVISVLNITHDTAVAIARERISNFYVLNLTANNHKVYIGVRFKTINKEYCNLYYAVLELDDQLSFRNCFFVQGQKYFTMLPFYPLEFRNEHTVLMPALGDKKEDAGIAFYEFSMNASRQRLAQSIKTTEKFTFYGMIGHFHNLTVYPVIYNVSGSNGHYFFQHPFPILYDTAGKTVMDPYNAKRKKDSLNTALNKMGGFNNYNYSLQHYASHKSLSNIILATSMHGNTIYMVVSNADENKIDLFTYDVKTAEQTVKTLDIAIKDTYMVFSGNELYILDHTGEKGLIKSVKL
jgi:hypothetical protein